MEDGLLGGSITGQGEEGRARGAATIRDRRVEGEELLCR